MFTEALSLEAFEEAIVDDTSKIIIDFVSRTCAPCKALGVTLQDFSKKYPKQKIIKVDVEIINELARKFFVRSVPTLIILQDGEVKTQWTGTCSEKKLLELLEE